MRARLQPRSREYRLRGRRRGDDDVGVAHRLLGRRSLLHPVERGGATRRAAPHQDTVEVTHGTHRIEVRGRLEAGTEDCERSSTLPREHTGGHA